MFTDNQFSSDLALSTCTRCATIPVGQYTPDKYMFAWRQRLHQYSHNFVDFFLLQRRKWSLQNFKEKQTIFWDCCWYPFVITDTSQYRPTCTVHSECVISAVLGYCVDLILKGHRVHLNYFSHVLIKCTVAFLCVTIQCMTSSANLNLPRSTHNKVELDQTTTDTCILVLIN